VKRFGTIDALCKHIFTREREVRHGDLGRAIFRLSVPARQEPRRQWFFPIHHDLWHKKNLADVFAVLNEVMGISCFIEFEALRNLRLDDALGP
jgi:hypothetical protein